MVRDSALRKIVRANFLRAIARFYLAAAFRGDLLMLLLLLQFVEPGAKHAHGFGAILDLRFLVLLRNNQPRR